MPRKFQIDELISSDLKTVAADSFTSNILMIDVDKINPNKQNFFSLSEIEILADDIERQGLKHNLVVYEESNGSYTLLSGHRRLEAVKMLIKNNRIKSKYVPCYITKNKSQAEQTLDLIMLNATTRVMNDAEIMEQYIMLENTYKILEAEGKSFKGRMRERIAEALKISPAQVGKIENITHNAIEEVKTAVSLGNMSISTANEVAKLTAEKQKVLIESKSPETILNKEVKAQQQPKYNEVNKEKADIIPVEYNDDTDEDVDDENVYEEYTSSEKYSIELTLSEKEILKKAIHTITESGNEAKELMSVLKKLER